MSFGKEVSANGRKSEIRVERGGTQKLRDLIFGRKSGNQVVHGGVGPHTTWFCSGTLQSLKFLPRHVEAS